MTDWIELLDKESNETYFKSLVKIIQKDRENGNVYPPKGKVFEAFKVTPFDTIRVVILGQDPYSRKGQAHGLAFSVLPNVIIPPSLKNIFKELNTDVGFKPVGHGCLLSWARQGVLLLNTVLTVREGEPGSHKGIGWEDFTTNVIKELNKTEKRIIFVLWGKDAQSISWILNTSQHVIVESSHPSPYSAENGFFGSKPFSKINDVLKKEGSSTINWQLSDNPFISQSCS